MIVVLCGSTKFKEQFDEANAKLTLDGHIVLAPGYFAHHLKVEVPEDVKERLDELHKRKIDLADKVVVVCPGNYIGSSTKSEIEYAEAHNKPIEYWYNN